MEQEKIIADLTKYLNAVGKRNLTERKRLLEMVSEMARPFSIVDFFRQARSRGIGHGAAALNRHLFALIAAGFISEINLCDGKTIFESNLNADHNFLLCVGCGKLKKVKAGSFDSIERKVCAQHDFEPTNYLYQIKGYCSECQKKF